MYELSAPREAHPEGESKLTPAEVAAVTEDVLSTGGLALDLHGRRLHVEWDPHAPVTALCQLVYFSFRQFLATAGLFAGWAANCPLRYNSPNALSVTDVLGTWSLAVLAGNQRYAHVTALRGDTINPQGLGMSRVPSEDALRRAFEGEEPEPLERWQRRHRLRSVEPVLSKPWICDVDVSIKTVYGEQEGADRGHNSQTPERPAHAYHTFFILRLALDVGSLRAQAGSQSGGQPRSVELVGGVGAVFGAWWCCGKRNSLG
jgi:hypothetical protein